MDLARGLFQRGPTNREDREKGEEIFQLLDPDGYPGNAEVDLLSRLGYPLIDQPEHVTEPPPRLALGHDPESDLVAHQKERHVEIADLQCTPPARPALPVEHDAPLQVLIPLHQGRGHVEDPLASSLGGQPLGEGALAAAGAT